MLLDSTGQVGIENVLRSIIVKTSLFYAGGLNKVICYPIDIVTVINICKFINFRNRGSAESITGSASFIFCLSGDVVNRISLIGSRAPFHPFAKFTTPFMRAEKPRAI